MRKLLALLMVVAVLPLAQCSDDNGTGPENNPTEGDRIATEWFTTLGDSLDSISGMELDEIRNADFSGIRAGFNEALSKDADNPIGHVGLAIVDLLELNYSQDVWDVLDAFDEWLNGGAATTGQRSARHRSLIGRQFSLLVEAPLAVNTHAMAAFPPDLEFHNLQRIIETVILPRLRSSLNHLATAESHMDMRLRIWVEDEGVGEYVVIDLGEVYVFDASLRAAAAAFEMAIAYDVDLYGPDGTYDWIDEIRALPDADYWCAESYTVIPGAPYNSIEEYWRQGYTSAHEDSLMMRVLHHNLADRPAFLTLRNGGAVLSTARQDLLGTLNKLEASVDFIRNHRENETEENLIKLTNLTDIDEGLGGPDVPNFAKDFAKIEDVLDFVQRLLSQPVQFSEELGPNRTTFTWTMDLGRQFTLPVTNVKALLPYHRWNLPSGNWITVDEYLSYEWDNAGWGYYTSVWNGDYCEQVYLENIGLVSVYMRDYNLTWGEGGPLEFLDGPSGNPIDMEIERLPYFPDYTMNQLFPDMGSRQRWLDLIDILDPPVQPQAASRR